ncbi:MAG: HRDC domain-containing protein [Nocardioides sp.]
MSEDTTETTDPAPDPESTVAPLLTLRDGLPPVIATEAELATACAALADGAGPTAIDAERASGYRYSSRAYLIQLRRAGAGSFLIDPIGLSTLAPLDEALADTEWILHAATQDLPCLTEVGLRPRKLFDTELAGRLLGYPRVGLATLTETILGQRMRKEHSAVDWSTRPLPAPWLTYAALDVEVLVELRDVLHQQLVDAGKWTWAQQEFESLLTFQPAARPDAWRRTTGIHKVRGVRGLAAVRALWHERDRLAQERDVTPTRILPDTAIVVAAQAAPSSRSELLSVRGFHGRGAERYANQWLAALREAAAAPEADLPTRSPASDGPPQPRAWTDKDPAAARRLAIARESITQLAAEHQLPVENLITPDHLRRVLWSPPPTRQWPTLITELSTQLSELGARDWQIDLAVSALAEAIVAGDADPSNDAEPEPSGHDDVGEADPDSASEGTNTV